MDKYFLKYSVLVLVTLFIYPNIINAQQYVPVRDADNLQQNTRTVELLEALIKKEYELDPKAQEVAAEKVFEVSKDVQSFIASGGPNGGPVFVENLLKFKTSLVQSVATDFLGNTTVKNSELKNLPDYMGEAVWSALVTNTNSQTNQPQTINGAVVSEDFARGNFHDGGWDAWFEMTQNPDKNPYDAYEKAKNELQTRQSLALKDQETKLDWYGGFLPTVDAQGNIITPGSSHKLRLEDALGSSVRILEQIDEYKDIADRVGNIYEQYTNILNNPTGSVLSLADSYGLNLNSLFKFDFVQSFNLSSLGNLGIF